MNQANQKAVIQEANMNLVGIRALELNYFNDFYTNFATQAAILVGLIIGSVSQVPGLDNPADSPYFFVSMYWVTSAVTISAGVYGLVCAVFIQVFGQGLGLRGPPGSMVRAIEGMVVEQQNILTSFTISIFAYGLNNISMYWQMMDNYNAIICMIISVIGMVFWYRYSLRLYNRFSWNSLKVEWGEDERDPTKDLEDLDPSIVNKMHQDASSGKAKRESKKDGSSVV
eukprot:gene40604-49506_t